jgi:hypothetical protein
MAQIMPIFGCHKSASPVVVYQHVSYKKTKHQVMGGKLYIFGY